MLINILNKIKPFKNRQMMSEWWPLFLIIILLTGSFVYGWIFDSSHIRSGLGLADQDLYLQTTKRLASGQMPLAGHLHFQIGYSVLGVLGYFIWPKDPFLVCSLALLIGSALFCYLASIKIIGRSWTVVFLVLLFAWDGIARTMNSTSDMFAIPWNNQVLFFVTAFFFWLFTTKTSQPANYKMATLIGLISGASVLTREETLLFMLPILAAYFLLTKTQWRKSVLALAVMVLCFTPQLIVKKQVLGSITASGRSDRSSKVLGSTKTVGYGSFTKRYLQPKKFIKNVGEVVVHSSYFTHKDARRKALLQASPWLWLSPIGIVCIFYRKRYPMGLKIFTTTSLLIAGFYLSGENMSAAKLKFHCLRYISSSFIILNFTVVIALKELYEKANNYLNNARGLSRVR